MPALTDGAYHGAMDIAEAVALYGAVRKTRPAVCIETGVANGLSSAFILDALRVNGSGHLISIDLPGFSGAAADQAGQPPDPMAVIPQGRAPGWLVPEGLRQRWRIEIGPSVEVLPALLERLGAIGFFLHDSDHTYECMTFEYEQALPRLRPGGVLVSHDIHATEAFADFTRARDVAFDSLGQLGAIWL